MAVAATAFLSCGRLVVVLADVLDVPCPFVNLQQYSRTASAVELLDKEPDGQTVRHTYKTVLWSISTTFRREVDRNNHCIRFHMTDARRTGLPGRNDRTGLAATGAMEVTLRSRLAGPGRAESPFARRECLHRQIPDQLSRLRVGQPVTGEKGEMPAHLERGARRGIGAPAALLQPPVQVRGDGGEGTLAVVFTVLLRVGQSPVGGRGRDVVKSMCWLRHELSEPASLVGAPPTVHARTRVVMGPGLR